MKRGEEMEFMLETDENNYAPPNEADPWPTSAYVNPYEGKNSFVNVFTKVTSMIGNIPEGIAHGVLDSFQAWLWRIMLHHVM